MPHPELAEGLEGTWRREQIEAMVRENLPAVRILSESHDLGKYRCVRSLPGLVDAVFLCGFFAIDILERQYRYELLLCTLLRNRTDSRNQLPESNCGEATSRAVERAGQNARLDKFLWDG